MSIEQLIKENTEAINRNTEAVLALAGKAPATNAAAKTETTKTDTTKAAATTKGGAAGKKEAPKPKHTEEEVVAALTKIKEEFGADPAKEIVKKLGFAKMAEITPEKFDEAVELATKKYEELVEEAGGDGGDDL